MSHVLVVPIHLDALHLDEDEAVVEAMVDFSRLPYADGTRDVHPNVAYISEAIDSEPFQNKNLHLKAGLHLHWALPDTLTRGVQEGSEGAMVFPRVPNRWLITRTGGGKHEKQWIVESDYLYPDGEGHQAGSISFPFTPDAAGGQCRPFRYLGRSMTLAAWPGPSDPGAEYLNDLTPEGLTAVGYGEPAFAAFYPNCHSVFGFYDREIVHAPPEGLQYDVVGWYSDADKDYGKKYLQPFADAFKRRYIDAYRSEYGARENPIEEDLTSALTQALEDEFRWSFPLAESQEIPPRLCCYARLTVGEQEASAGRDATIAVGNTGTEALSAYLASLLQDASHDKAFLEDQLEALLLASGLQGQTLDLGPAFKAARHEKGFTPVHGGLRWTVQAETEAAAATNGALPGKPRPLPPDLAPLLHTLNRRQQAYNRALQDIESMRRQLFADWYKYMLCAYPPEGVPYDYPEIDLVKHFIEEKDLKPLQEKIDATGTLMGQEDQDGQITAFAADPASARLAAGVAAAGTALLGAVAGHNAGEEARTARTTYTLKSIAGPRYWQPNEPVVLITGPAARPSLRHGHDGLLACLRVDGNTADAPGLSAFRTAIRNAFKNASNVPDFALGTWKAQPWNPFLMEWEVKVAPASNGCNLTTDDRDYAPGYIMNNYVLGADAVDLRGRAAHEVDLFSRTASTFSGRTVLTPHATKPFKEHAKALRREDLPAYLDEALKKIDDEDFHVLSQSLGGFNDALLGQTQTLQLSIADPIGFPDYQAFASAARVTLHESLRMAPEPLNNFTPIRTGAMQLMRLRLVDTFGQAEALDVSPLIAPERMVVQGVGDMVWLPPRLAQPARINFRWLAAGEGAEEMNAATHPICGWILPNNLDRSLMIYDQTGKALGAVDQDAQWQPAPGQGGVAQVDGIGNPHLQKMVRHLLDQGEHYLENFVDVLNTALENIDPEGFAQHQSMALLVGRPVAVVRASLHFELYGLPAVHNGWNVFRQDFLRNTRETDAFTRVTFPIRLGAYKRFNDGTVGYWIEDGAGYRDDCFYAPQSNPDRSDHIITRDEAVFNIEQSIERPPHVLTLLVDPRGVVHATTGILPAKAIDIPAEQYADALDAIEVTFTAAPILTGRHRLRLPLPEEPGYEWAWIARKDATTWREQSQAGFVTEKDICAAFSEAVWQALLDKKWIEAPDAATGRARIVRKDERGEDTLGADLKDQEPAIELLLARAAIGTVSPAAGFDGLQVVREGWLQLSKAEDTLDEASHS